MRRAGRILMRVLAAIGLLFVLVTVTPVDAWWINLLDRPWNDPKGDVLVVLGADAVRDVIGWSSYWRSVYAVRVWREGGFREIVVSGGAAAGVVPVAERMRDYMVSQGVPPDVIRVETQSQSTRENALRCKALLESLPGKKILLTSDYHTFRASRTFRKVGIAIEPRPFPDALKRITSPAERWPVFLGLCRESAKSAYYFLRGWI